MKARSGLNKLDSNCPAVIRITSAMQLSVIISTYNQPAWLEKVIWGYVAQTHCEFELVIADDGSQTETRDTIDRLRQETGLVIRHVWHEDRGFRKCTILNQATLQTRSEYLVFTDGDCIPRSDFLAQHAASARPGCMLSGSTVRLPKELSQRITKADILTGQATNFRWLCARGLPWNLKLLRRSAGPRLARWLDRLTFRTFHWMGCNASMWKADLLRVNGFDERIAYLYDDWELGERLKNLGIRGKRVNCQAVCVHLDHARGYLRAEAKAHNRAIYDETRRSRAVGTAYGIVKQTEPLEKQAA